MTRNGLFGATLLATLAAPGLAAAQEADTGAAAADQGRWYLSMDASLGAANDAVAGSAYNAEHSIAVGAGLGVGYVVGPVRLEGQLRFENFRLDDLRPRPGSPLAATNNSGDLTAYGLMGNVYYDFGSPGAIRPFVGVGVGILQFKAYYREATCAGGFEYCPKVVTGTDNVFAGQAMAGVHMAGGGFIDEWFVGYRYLRTDDIDLSIVGVGPVTQTGAESHSLLLGLVHRFSS